MSCPHGNPHKYCDICDEINAAYDRGYADGLAEQDKQEPVAWRIGNEICAREDWACVIPHGSFVGKGRAIPDSWVPLLYAAPVSAKMQADCTLAAVLAEREACAKVCDDMANNPMTGVLYSWKCAAAIRARGEK